MFDETAFKFNFRIDGKPLWSSALEDFRGTTKRSWAVVMANRSGGSSSSVSSSIGGGACMALVPRKQARSVIHKNI